MLTSYQNQILKAFSEWVGTFCTPDDYFCLSVKNKEYFFSFRFPLKLTDRPYRIGRRDVAGARFILSIGEDKFRRAFFLSQDMTNFFTFGDLTIFEKKIDFAERQILPRDKQWLLKTAREVLAHYLEHGNLADYKSGEMSSPRLLKTFNIGVAFWLRGRLHGSQIVFGHHLYEGIVEAVARTIQDERFEPLAPSDLDEIRIEVSIFDDFYIPIEKQMVSESVSSLDLDLEKGYVVTDSSSGRRGYFLPEVFNVLSFSNLYDVFEKLASAKIQTKLSSTSELAVFRVEAFIESNENDYTPVMLRGPLSEPQKRKEHDDLASSAGEWLLSLQKENGYIPAFVDVERGVTNQADWPRAAFVCRALFARGVVGEEKQIYAHHAQKFYELLQNEIKTNRIPKASRVLTYAYLGQAAYYAHDMNAAITYMGKSMHLLQNHPFDPICYAQVTTLLKQVSLLDKGFEQKFLTLRNFLKERFIVQVEQDTGLNIIAWAELLNIFCDQDKVFVQELIRTIRSYQLEDGSFFVSTPQQMRAGAKGTAKMFEVLSLFDDTEEEQERILAWLSLMQYNGGNTYHLRQDVAACVQGGFREDYLNRTAWTDTVGHLLIGMARRDKRESIKAERDNCLLL